MNDSEWREYIEKLYTLKESYIIERNKITGSIFKCYNPFYKRKLRKIDAEIDLIEEAIYYSITHSCVVGKRVNY